MNRLTNDQIDEIINAVSDPAYNTGICRIIIAKRFYGSEYRPIDRNVITELFGKPFPETSSRPDYRGVYVCYMWVLSDRQSRIDWLNSCKQ